MIINCKNAYCAGRIAAGITRGSEMTTNTIYRHVTGNKMRAQFLWRMCKTLMKTISGATIIAATMVTAVSAAELNIYSHRQPFLIQPFLDAFTAKTGIKTNVVFASKGLAQRLEREGENSPADVVLTVDIARLSVYAQKGLFSKIESAKLNNAIPAHLRDSEGFWYGLSVRSRIIGVSKDRVQPGEIQRYEDLADPKWRGRICSRPGSHVYNRSLVASMIAAHGEEKAEAWAKGVVSNFARRPQGNDRAQAKAIYQGVCDVAIMNHYYYGNMLTSDEAEQRDWANAINIIFANQGADDRGAHINISGGGVTRYSKNKDNAIRLLEFLISDEAQQLYGKINYEYPVSQNAPIASELELWGNFKQDQLPINKLADFAPKAQMIIDRVGW